MSDEKKIRRITIQQAIEPGLSALIEKVQSELGLSGTDPDHQRRIYRAVVTLMASRLLDLGAPPQVVLHQAMEALASEVKYRGEKALAQQQPFGLQPAAKA